MVYWRVVMRGGLLAAGRGGIAQLVERLHGMQEVSGSNPLISTTMSPSSRGLGHRPFTAATGVRIPLGMPALFLRRALLSFYLLDNAARHRGGGRAGIDNAMRGLAVPRFSLAREFGQCLFSRVGICQ